MSLYDSDQKKQRNEPDIDDLMQTIVDSVQPDRRAIHQGVERRLRSRIFQNIVSKETGTPVPAFAYRRWLVVCSVAFVLSLVVYTTLYSGGPKNHDYYLLPVGQTQLAGCGKEVSEFSQIDAMGETIKTSAGGLASLYQTNGYRVRLAQLSSLQVVDDACVRLNEGSLFAEVEKRQNPAKPFSIDAGELKVIVLGTEFSVKKTPSSIEVAVVEGSVRVVPVDGDKRTLKAGESVTFQNGKIGEPVKIAVERIASWRQTLIKAENENSHLGDLMKKYYPSRM